MAKSLGLMIPERHKAEKGAFSIRPKHVEQWAKSLPKANLGETARLLYNALLETNRQKLPFQDRARFLESLREQILYVTDSMRKHFIGLTYPLPDKNLNIAMATREILGSMATGYKIAIEDSVSSHRLFEDKKFLTTLLHRAIRYSGRVLLTSYQIYSPYPENIWSELHKLYAYAEARKLHIHNVDDYELHYIDSSSITAEYNRILLLALTSPYHLRQGEVFKIYNTLERWTRHCVLSTLTSNSELHHNGYFALSLNQDSAPRPIAQMKLKESNAKHTRILNTLSLSEALRDELEDNQEVVANTLTSVDLSRPDLSHDLLQRLLIAWGIESKRSFPRSRKNEQVHVTIGLSTTHKFLSQQSYREENTGRDKFDNPAQYNSTEVKSLNEQDEDIWSLVYPSDASAVDTSALAPLLEQEISHLHHQYQPVQNNSTESDQAGNWAILNESASGYCLEYNSEQGARAQVGELVGIRSSGNDKSRKRGIGAIRWIKFTPQQTLQLGIEMLNPDAAAIGLRSAASPGESTQFQRTLMLPEIQAISQPASLITAPVPWRAGNRLILNILGKEMNVTLTQCMQNTGLFAQYRFEIEDSKKIAAQSEQEHEHKHKQEQAFAQVWTII